MSKENKLLPPLPNGINGQVVTRFPPENSGMLHLGHLKALLINYLYAKQYNGKIILRIDDTNPSKEKSIYTEAILADIERLHLECDQITYASDYFDVIIDYAHKLLRKDLAYIDFSNNETIKKNRLNLEPTLYRAVDIDTNIENFNLMMSGEITNACLRAKIDFKNKNGAMRDPVIFRYKNLAHSRTGTKYLIYPTYDFSCPILDSIQGVTHAMRSIEYTDRDIQYNWFLEKLGLKNKNYPKIMNYGKLNFMYTVLSKRKLTKLIDANLVEGWSDPRMPTIQGILRKGIKMESLLSYIKTQLTSRSVVLLSWDQLLSFNNNYLDKITNRLFGLNTNFLTIDLVGNLPEYVTLPNHPKNTSAGDRKMMVTSKLLIDSDDFINAKKGDRFTLIGLGNTTLIQFDPITLQYDANDLNFKDSVKIIWLPNVSTNIKIKVKKFGHLLTKPKLEENDDILMCFNKNSIEEKELLLEESIKKFSTGTIIQIMRKGYFYLDKNTVDEIILNQCQ